MRIGLVALCLAYVMSQFFRAFLAVLTQVLERDIGASAEDLALASGLWFLTFALMQIPVGWALDRIGPRLTGAVLFGLGAGGGAAVFALASAPWHIGLAMALIGVGCAPALMASFYIFARLYPAGMFATLGAVMIGVGSLGNILGSAPLAFAVETYGWRVTMGGLGFASVLIAALALVTVQDPPRAESTEGGSLWTLLKMPALWPILPLMLVAYAAPAGLRGLWIGPYLSDVYGANAAVLGRATLIMGVAMILGTFAYGPLDRIFGTRKWVVTGGVGLMWAGVVLVWQMPGLGYWPTVWAFAWIGFFGAAYPVMIAHGRGLFPDHLVGRGVTFLNLCSIGGVGVVQVITGRLYRAASDGVPAEARELAYQPIFGLFAITVAVGLVIYLFSRDA